MTVRVELPGKLLDVFEGPADVRWSCGGRGSGKTRSFAKMAALYGYKYGMAGTSGIILCARQFMNSLADSSLEEVKRAIEDEPFLAAYYDIGEKYIKSIDGRISFAFAGLDRNIASIKSKGRLLLCWVDEAEPVTDEAWSILEPTLREEGEDWRAELWVTWNPLRKTAAVESRYRFSKDANVKGCILNWRDNPKFPAVLERKRLRDKAERPGEYPHIWEGEYATVITGAYYAEGLLKAKEEGRIGPVAADPVLTLRAYVDIGGTGRNADSFALWVCQFVGLQIRVLDYYEAQGQPMATHVNWLRSKGYTPERLQIWLPHDGNTGDKVFAVTPASALQEAGYATTVIPNQGRGAAMKRVEATRRLFDSIWFNETTTEPGRDALGWYHAKLDEQRGIDLGPEHDWSSHACLVGGSLVHTDKGAVPIECVRVGDSVVTPAGIAKVLQAGPVKVATSLIRLQLADGRSLDMTPEHKVFTIRGLVCADELRYNDSIFTVESETCLELGRVNLMGYRAAFTEYFEGTGIGFGQNAGSMFLRKAGDSECFTGRRLVAASMKRLFPSMEIGMTLARKIGRSVASLLGGCRKAFTTGRNLTESVITASRGMGTTHAGIPQSSSCIGPCGHCITGQYLAGTISTTSMVTRAITGWRIWSLLAHPIMRGTTPHLMSGLVARLIKRSYAQLACCLPSGTKAMKVDRGTSHMANLLGNRVNQRGKRAKSAALNTTLSGRVNPGTAVAIVARERVIAQETVYDLTVEKHHCYFANGVLVSNSDAFGLMCCDYTPPAAMQEIVYKRRFLA